MKYILLAGIKFYQNNGVLGMCLEKVVQLRAGSDNFSKISHTLENYSNSSSNSEIPRTKEWIDGILNDDEISEVEKKPFRNLREHPAFGDSKKLKDKQLRKSLIAKTQNPVYSNIKSKIAYAIMSPFTFSELSRLAAHRVAGFTSAPLTLPAIIGFSMPCAVTFSMLEMYAPDKFKFPCKCAKWTGGLVFYGVCGGIDYITEGIETRIFGQPLPIDAPQLMGTLPNKNDLKELREIKKLSDSLLKKSNPMDLLGEE